MSLVRRTRWYAHLFTGIGCLVFLGVLNSSIGEFHPLMLVAGLIVVVAMIYNILRFTSVTIRDNRLTVHNWPFGRSTEVPADQVDQIYCIRRSQRYTDEHGQTQVTNRYDVFARLHSKSIVELAVSLRGGDAVAIERAIEDHLGIRDEQVLGAVNRS